MGSQDDFVELAKELIDESGDGRTFVLRTMTKSGPDRNPSFVPSDQNVVGVFISQDIMKPNNAVLAGDKFILCSSNVIITGEEKIIDEGQEFEIVQVAPTKTGEQLIMYMVHIRS